MHGPTLPPINTNFAKRDVNFYSQYAEDVMLAELFSDQKGICVEVGANDGVTFSNTKHFEEIGWKCILVEPTPTLCKKIRGCRTGLLFECAASSSEGEMTLHVAEGHDLYSSLEPQGTMSSELEQRQTPIHGISVKVRTLNDILSEAAATQIDFVSIDVEGHELSVLQGFDLSRWRPKILLVEDNSDMDRTGVERHLTANGYRRFYRSGGNDWYAPLGFPVFGWLCKMLRTGKLKSRGLFKVWLPRRLIRGLLTAKRRFRPSA